MSNNLIYFTNYNNYKDWNLTPTPHSSNYTQYNWQCIGENVLHQLVVHNKKIRDS